MARMDEFARTIGELATITRIGARSSTFIDTNPVPADWDHVTKIDPEDTKKLPLLYPLYLRHTSAVSIGGSQDVTNRNTAETFALLGQADVPLFHEPSAPHHITKQTWKRSTFTTIPEVLNGDSTSLVGKLGAAIENIRDEIVPELIDETVAWLPRQLHPFLSDFVAAWLLEQAVFEAYIIQNVDSAAAREANVTDDDRLSSTEAAQRALAAEKHLDSEVIYIEYSGTFGGDEAVAIIEAVADSVSWSRVWYGGGLDSRENTEAILDAGANAVIVGDIFHDVAAEEADLCAESVEALAPDADRDDIRRWVTSAVDLEDTSATRYLATIPDVRNPTKTATEYLTATVQTVLALERLAAKVDGDDPGEIRQAIHRFTTRRDTLPWTSELERTAGEDSADLAREYAVGVLADRADLTDEPTLPIRHVSLF